LITNAPDKAVAVKFLFDNFDAAGFSIWRINYDKVEGECEKMFMTSNLVGGFL